MTKIRKKIIVSVTSDLVTDNRVQKVCTTLYENGYDVLLIGRKLKKSKPISRPYKIKRFCLLFNKSALFYVEYNIRLFFFLLFSKADLFLSNDTDTLPANYYAAKIRRKPLVFDAHEMFPEVPELADRPFVKNIWTKIENRIFPHLKNSYTVCKSISDEYYKRYGIKMEVVRNIPIRASVVEHPSVIEHPSVTEPSAVECTQTSIVEQIRNQKSSGKKIIIYQGAVNIGRGIEKIIDTMSLLPDFIFYIVGDGDILQSLKEKVADNTQIVFTGSVPADELRFITKEADVGVNILEKKGLNYYYSLPNRIFDYMSAGIPVISTDFPEIRNIVEKYNTGILITHYEPEYLASVIKQTSYDKPLVKCDEFSWEKESEKIIEMLKKM
ncbi:MAG: glycosyltransferase [Bacteroidales bacterium]|nr:glycosyltransferase [Bacteroidales bacterium]